METLENIQMYAIEKPFTVGSKLFTASHDTMILAAQIGNLVARRTNLSKTIITGSKDKKTHRELKEVVKYLTLKIDVLKIGLGV